MDTYRRQAIIHKIRLETMYPQEEPYIMRDLSEKPEAMDAGVSIFSIVGSRVIRNAVREIPVLCCGMMNEVLW